MTADEIEEEQSDDEEQEMRTRSGTARKSYFLVGDSKPRPLGNQTLRIPWDLQDMCDTP